MPTSARQLAEPVRPLDELERLAALHRYDILDTEAEQDFDDLTLLAAQLCDRPMAATTLVDAERQWLKSACGLARGEIPRRDSFCAHALHSAELLVVADARRDPRFADNPLVTGEPYLRSYIGAPLVTPDGHVLGTLCVFGPEPGALTPQQGEQLRALARQVVSQLERRRQNALLIDEVERRGQAERALRESTQLLDDVLASTDVLVFVKDLGGRFLVANDAVLQALGKTSDQVLGRTDHDLFPAGSAEEFRRNDREVAASTGRRVYTEQIQRPDGSVGEYLSTKFALTDADGRVYAVAGVSSNITDLLAERASRAEAEQRWRALVEHSPSAVLVLTADGRLAYANDQVAHLVGASSGASLIGRAMDEMLADADAAHQMLASLLAGTSAGTRQWQLRRLDGGAVTVEVIAALVMHRGERAVQAELRDVTERVAAAQALNRALEQLEAGRLVTDAVLDTVDVGIVACDAQGRPTLLNDRSRAWHGLDRAAQVGLTDALPETFSLHDTAGRPMAADQMPLARALREGEVHSVEMVIAPSDRPATRVLCSARALRTRDGRALGAVAAMTDITAERAQTLALQASEQRFRTTFDNDPRGLAVLGTTGRAVQVNPALCRLLRRGDRALLQLPRLICPAGLDVDDDLLVRADEELADRVGACWSTEVPLQRADGQQTWTLLTFTRLPGDQDLVQVEDITARRDAERRLTRQARFDSLTELPNRFMLLEQAERMLARARRSGQEGRVVLLFCDLDGFKAVNDAHGHAAGDRLLVEVAARLRLAVRPADTVARLGGDEFVVLCETAREGDIASLATRLAEVVADPVPFGRHLLRVTASVGVAIGHAGATASELLRRADAAMYGAKRCGPSRYEVFEDRQAS